MATWTPQLVENLLFRQYLKGEDVSGSIPPTPQPSEINDLMSQYEGSAKMMLAFLKHSTPAGGGPALPPGPTALVSSTKPLGAPPAMRALTPKSSPPPVSAHKPGAVVVPSAAVLNALNAVTSSVAAAGGVPPRTPKSKSPTPAPDSPVPKRDRVPGEVSSGSTPKNKAKKIRVEWPLTVPTNAQLKADKRSAVAHLTTARVKAQDGVDPDLLFAQPLGEFPLQSVFFKFPEALKSIAASRGLSGDWRNDTFTAEEEAQYKRDMMFVHLGPSQCVSGTLTMF
jgi:hypothetical protein